MANNDIWAAGGPLEYEDWIPNKCRECVKKDRKIDDLYDWLFDCYRLLNLVGGHEHICNELEKFLTKNRTK